MSELILRCKELKLFSDGTPSGTQLLLDGKLVGRVCRIFLEADAKEPEVIVTVEAMDDQDNVCPPQVVKFTQGD